MNEPDRRVTISVVQDAQSPGNMRGLTAMLKAMRDEAIELKNTAVYLAFNFGWIPYVYVVRPLFRRIHGHQGR